MEIFGFFALALGALGLLGSVFKKKAAVKQTTLDDFDVPQVADGTPHAVVFGDGWLEGWQVLWYGNYRTTKIKKNAKKG